MVSVWYIIAEFMLTIRNPGRCIIFSDWFQEFGVTERCILYRNARLRIKLLHTVISLSSNNRQCNILCILFLHHQNHDPVFIITRQKNEYSVNAVLHYWFQGSQMQSRVQAKFSILFNIGTDGTDVGKSWTSLIET